MFSSIDGHVGVATLTTNQQRRQAGPSAAHLGVELGHELGAVGGDQGAVAGDALAAEARPAHVRQLPPQTLRHLPPNVSYISELHGPIESGLVLGGTVELPHASCDRVQCQNGGRARG